MIPPVEHANKHPAALSCPCKLLQYVQKWAGMSTTHCVPGNMDRTIWVQRRDYGPPLPLARRAAVLFRDSSLFQFHEEQDEDRPHPNRCRKLGRLCISQKRTSSWKRKTKQEHGYSREYPENQFAFPGHFALPRFQFPMCWVCVLASAAMLDRSDREVNGLRRAS